MPCEDFVPDRSFYAGPRPSPGNVSLTITVAGVAVRLDGLDPDRDRTLRRRYGVFCDAPPGAPDMVVRVTLAGRPGFLQVARASELYRVHTRWEGDTLYASSYEWAGWIDPSRKTGGLSLGEITEVDAAAFDRSIENFLRVAYAHLMVARGGFVLHSAGLVRDERAYLFFGPSGSGKTTVTTLSPGALVLSDDLTLVVPMDGGGYGACSVPFRGVFAPQPTSIRTFPLAGFFRLIQAGEDRLDRVAGARAVGELVGSLPFVTERPEWAGAVMDAVAGAVSKVPVFRLHFRKDRTFWKVIDGMVPIFDDFSAVRGIKS